MTLLYMVVPVAEGGGGENEVVDVAGGGAARRFVVRLLRLLFSFFLHRLTADIFRAVPYVVPVQYSRRSSRQHLTVRLYVYTLRRCLPASTVDGRHG